jgi:chorismate synthase
MLSIPSTKGFEIGSGFRGTTFPGSTHNDPFIEGKDGKLRTATNWSGGVQGGITNGEDIYFRYVGPGTSKFKSIADGVGSDSSLQQQSRRNKRLPSTTVKKEY